MRSHLVDLFVAIVIFMCCFSMTRAETMKVDHKQNIHQDRLHPDNQGLIENVPSSSNPSVPPPKESIRHKVGKNKIKSPVRNQNPESLNEHPIRTRPEDPSREAPRTK